MSNNVIIGGIVAIVLLGGGVWWYQSQSSNEEGTAGAVTSERTTEEPGTLDALTGRFTDFITRGESVQCRFSGTDPDTGEFAEGTVYASGEQYYIEVTTVVENMPVAMKMIQTEETMYIWSDNEAVVPAMSFDMTAFASSDTTDSEPMVSSPTEWFDDVGTEVDYDCRRWSPRANSFTPPADIEFANPFAGMMEMMSGMEGMMDEDMMRMFEGAE